MSGAKHPATHHLSEELKVADADTVAAYLPNLGEPEAPPGLWSFSFLVGRSFAPIFIEQPKRGELQVPDLFQCEAYGAWEAFTVRSVEILKSNDDAKMAAVVCIEKIID
jgi:hypothetical protein